MLTQQIATEVTFEITPNSVDMIRVVLCIVVLDQEARSLNPVVVRFASTQRACPGEGDAGEIGFLQRRAATRSERIGHPAEVHVDESQQDCCLFRPEVGYSNASRRQRVDSFRISSHDVTRRR